MKPFFIEKQKFTQWWVWVIPAGVLLLALYGLIQQLVFGSAFGDQPMSDAGLILFLLFAFCFVYFFWFMTLVTEVSEQGIFVRFVPFTKKSIPWSEIKSAKIVHFPFVGYGIRMGSQHGTIYTMKGNKGLAIQLHSGKKLIIGTQKQTTLIAVVEKYLSP